MPKPPVAVSVLTPVWNAQATLARAVASVVGQDFADWEMIIVDDGSTDNSWAEITRLAEGEPRLRPLRQAANGGAARARNAALEAAQGRYIAFLDADDEWLPGKLSRQIAMMERTHAAFSYTGYWRVRGEVQDTRRRQVRVPETLDHATLLRGNVIGCLTAIYDTGVLGKVAMPDLRRRQDYGLWLTLLRRVDRAHGLPEPLAIYHQAPGSLSSRGIGGKIGAQIDTWRMYRAVEGMGPVRAAGYLAQHLWQRLRG